MVNWIGPLVFAILLPVLVWWVASMFARGVALFEAQTEIDRRLRELPGARAALVWAPWRRESLAYTHIRSLPADRGREGWLDLMRQNSRAMNLQVGWSVANLVLLSAAWGFAPKLLPPAAIAAVGLVWWRRRWHAKWRLM